MSSAAVSPSPYFAVCNPEIVQKKLLGGGSAGETAAAALPVGLVVQLTFEPLGMLTPGLKVKQLMAVVVCAMLPCQRRLNVDPPPREVAEVKLTHLAVV